MFLSLIVQLIINDFVAVVMFKNRAKIMEAGKKTIALIRSHKADCLIYI
jgi:hypothetical protein